MTVNNFRKASSSDEVISLAKSLIKSWKKLLPGLFVCLWCLTPLLTIFQLYHGRFYRSIPLYKNILSNKFTFKLIGTKTLPDKLLKNNIKCTYFLQFSKLYMILQSIFIPPTLIEWWVQWIGIVFLVHPIICVSNQCFTF